MRVPVEWLQQYCAPRLDVHALGDRLAMTGTEVERIERHGVGALQNFVVGRVLEAGRHPDADRLSVCLVDAGDGEPRRIVCGAPNVAVGQTVAVAKPGAVMPDGTKLRKAKLRGQESDGMILAEDELAIGTEHAGIIVLSEDGLAPGTPLEQVLPIATDVLVLEVTPNRPDCLGIYGVAREVHAATEAPLNAPPWAQDPHPGGEVRQAKISVECPELCPRFTARVFEDVKIGPSPLWLKARLMASGQRPISNVVDITNYVMLLTGQPLHAFDLDRVAGAELTVRRAEDGETIETLDGQTRTLDHEMVLIADAEGPTSIAGVMGGASSEVAPDTSRVLMEVANWIGANVHRTSLKLGLRSEASTRFEKQLQPEQALEAQAVATKLMVELCGARAVPGTIDVGGPGLEPRTIRLRDARIASLLGTPIPRERCRRILEALEFVTTDADDGLDVKPPAFRRDDVTREADLIEEVARIDGLEKLPATLPSRHGASGLLTTAQALRRRAADALTAQGLDEIVGWSFARPELARRLRLRPQRDRGTGESDVSGTVPTANDVARLASGRRSAQSRPRVLDAPTVRGGCDLPPQRRERAPTRALPRRSAARRRRQARELARTAAKDCRLLRRQGGARRAARHAPRSVGGPGRASSRSFTPVRPQRFSPAGDPSDGSARFIPRWRPNGTFARRSRRLSSISTPPPSMPCLRRSTRT